MGKTLTADTITPAGTAGVSSALPVDDAATVDGALNAGQTLISGFGLGVGGALTMAAGSPQFDDRLSVDQLSTSCP